MRPLNPRRLKGYIAEHPDAEPALRSWWATVQAASWQNFSEVRLTFSSASYVDPFTVFNIKGNHYRLVTYIDYERGLIVMKWFGPHPTYDEGKWK